ncbi:MAG: hypothetical protein ACP5N1_03185 [Candidatus Woesearchaeota archaeon]
MKYTNLAKNLAYILIPATLLIASNKVNAQRMSENYAYNNLTETPMSSKKELSNYQIIVSNSKDIEPIDYVKISIPNGNDTTVYNADWSYVTQIRASPGQKIIVEPTKDSNKPFKPLEYILTNKETQNIKVE